MSTRIEEPQDWSIQMRLWQQAKHKRDLVLKELTQRMARQAESDGLLLRKLEGVRARLDVASRVGEERQLRMAEAWAS
ncbi:hypothetical protein SAMN05444161_5003 [Rhizobiales bacterium GAS191]|jgi:hypothetical protein|nr:hypothetical protein SAMN05519103_04275 [Rhizobiales bacterium GAS113]SEE15932.1 hypothetical protein SAMN05444161_5003 [Rhizobiales bacterium GAS191]